MATYIVKDSVLASATSSNPAHLKALRLSDNGLEGATSTLESDVILPNTRIKSVPETGSESSSGSISSEWNVDEQDDLIASAMCGNWVENLEKAEELSAESCKELVLGTSKDIYTLVKYFDQSPKEWQVYTGIQVNKMTVTMALNRFVKLSFDLLGSNNPVGVGEANKPFNDSKYEYDSAMITKAFKTLDGSIKIGNTEASLASLRQSPSFDFTVNNNKESTDALFEKEAIEQSDGDFDVSGNLEVWKVDELGMSLKNDAVNGADKVIEVTVGRYWYDEGTKMRTEYSILLHAHFTDPSEAKDGNKYKVSIPFSVNVENGIKFTKIVKEAD